MPEVPLFHMYNSTEKCEPTTSMMSIFGWLETRHCPLVPVDLLHTVAQLFHCVQQALGTAHDGVEILQGAAIDVIRTLSLFKLTELLFQFM